MRFAGPKIDYVARNRIRDARKASIWIHDQYSNPHETWNSIDEVCKWFEEEDFEFLNCFPPIMGTNSEDVNNLFSSTNQGTDYQRFVTQLAWIAATAREGGLLDVIGRKKT